MVENKKIKIGINGFGRIGRSIFRIAILSDYFDIVAINDLNDNLESIAYLLKYDSIHGNINQPIRIEDRNIIIKDMKVKVFHESAIDNVPWNNLGVEIVVGCTGNLENVDNAKKCMGSITKKVVFSDSPDKVDHTFVFGVSDNNYNPKKFYENALFDCLD